MEFQREAPNALLFRKLRLLCQQASGPVYKFKLFNCSFTSSIGGGIAINYYNYDGSYVSCNSLFIIISNCSIDGVSINNNNYGIYMNIHFKPLPLSFIAPKIAKPL